MKQTATGLAALLALSACGEPVPAPTTATPEPVARFADEWFYFDSADGFEEDIARGVINLHETAEGWAGWSIDSGSAAPLRQIRRTDTTLEFTLLANGGVYSAEKQADGAWEGKFVFPDGRTDPLPPGRLMATPTPPAYAAKLAAEFVQLPDGRRMHLSCAGQGEPVVLLDYGAGGTAKRDWADLATKMAAAANTRVCAYDRAGRGLSDPASTPRDAFAVADDIFNMVNNAGSNSPIVLVGHSLGSYHVRAFANGQAVRTAGLVLVDPSGDGQLERFNAKIPKIVEIQKAMFEAQAKLNCIGRLRETPVPPDDPLAQQCGGNDPEAIRATASEIEQMPGASTQQLISSRRSYGDMPLIVLTRGDYDKDMPPNFTAEDKAAMRSVWETMHAEMAALSTRGEQRLIAGAGHYIQRDAPDAVIQAVSDVVAAVRAGPK